jgi:putative acyl-CoA dehydrogenase
MVVTEALECHGGAGYVEESILPRLYREAPLGSIWEGSGNVICLDVLRALERDPESLDVALEELGRVRGRDERYDRALEDVEALARRRPGPAAARRFVEMLALVIQAALLLEHGEAESGELFCASRLGGERFGALGTLPEGAPLDRLVERATP